MTTLLVMLEGLGGYLAWWFRALVAWRDPRAPMGPRRALFLVAGMPLFLLVQVGHATCLLLDEILFPGYRRTVVHRPLFITGIPRSGTTFLHRTLATETDRYTTLTTWEALLAPSLCQRRLVQLAAGLDRLLGRPGHRAVSTLAGRLGNPLEAIHQVDPGAAEEDYLLLLPAGGCFLLLLAFPGAAGLAILGRLDRSARPARRRRLLTHYHRLLQRHVYADGGQRRLLSKNAAFGGWIRGLHETFPEAQFLICVREPGAALSSQISSVAGARTLFGTAVGTAAFQRLFLDLFGDTLGHLDTTLRTWPRNRAAVIDLEDLSAEPAATIAAALGRLGIVPGADLCSRLVELPRRPRSGHHHAVENLALPASTLTHHLRPPYQALLRSPLRIEARP